MEAFNTVFSYLSKYLLVFIILSLILFGLIFIIIKISSKNDNLYKIYGLFDETSNMQVLSLTLVLIRFIFLVSCLFFIDNNSITFTFVMILTLAYNILNFNLLNLVVDVTNNTIIYFAIIAKDVFINYYIDIYNGWYILLLSLVTIIFIFSYILYTTLKESYFILRKNKYIKKIEKKVV